MQNKNLSTAIAFAAGAAIGVSPLSQAADGPAGSEQTSLETIIVLGEKTQRSIMDTSSSVAVFDADELARRAGLDTTSDILDLIPNLVTSETSNFAPAVRGTDGTGPAQGADAFFAGTRPRLNFQADGRTLSYNEVIFSDATLWDIERVEVFRGPQSTLQGRNAVSGAVVVKTKDPTYDFEAGGRVLYGNYDTRQVSGAVAGPIVDDQIAFRLAADVRERQSYVSFEPFPGVGDPGQFESVSLRGKLLFEPDALPDLRALLTVNHTDAEAPQGADVARPFGDHVAAYPRMPRFGTRATSGIFDGSWEFSEQWALDGILSLTELRVHRWADPGTGIAEIDGREFVAEPRLRFSLPSGRLAGFVGAHIFRSEQDEFIDLFGGGAFDDHTDTDALFGEATVQATPTIDLTFGGRLERERRRRQGGAGPFLIDFDETYEVFLPKASLAWHASEDLTLGVVASRGYNGGAAGFTFEPPFVSYTYEPEYVRNFEAFSRAALFDGRLMLTSNLFYNQYEDLQLPFDLNPDPAVWSYVVRNAEEARTYGAEIGSRLLLREGFELFADLGLIQTKVVDYPGSDIEGNELARSPAFSFDLGVLYEHVSGLQLSLDARYSDSYFSDIDNDPRGKTDAYWVANASVAYTLNNARLFATVTNLSDSEQAIMLSPGATPAQDTATLLDPRSYSVGVSVDF